MSLGKKISVCLLTYNHAPVIQSTLRTILNQSIEDYEVIVSDDSSTDGTYERICEMAALDHRVKVIRTQCNLGMAGNANFAVSKCARPYIALLHHDDLYRRDLLEKWAALLEEHADMAFVFNSYGVHGSGRICAAEIPPGRNDGRWLLEKHLLARWGCLVRGTAMIRREAWKAAGGMRERFGLLADVDLWMRLSMGWAAGYVDEPLITVRQERPDYYPEIYKGSTLKKFWARQRCLYEIHAANMQNYLDLGTFAGWFAWRRFLVRLNLETMKWLAYAVVRRRTALITTSAESVTDYDFLALRLLRGSLRAFALLGAGEKSA